MTKETAIVQVNYPHVGISIDPIGEKPALLGVLEAFEGDAPMVGAFSGLLTLGAMGATIILGGGVFGVSLVLLGGGLAAINDMAYVSTRERFRSSRAKRIEIDEDVPTDDIPFQEPGRRIAPKPCLEPFPQPVEPWKTLNFDELFDDAPVSVPAFTSPRTSAELLARLQAECPDLLLLVKAPPIRLVGRQRTGKSTFARKLALLRSVLLPSHTIGWATPHREADNPVPEALNPFGVNPDGSKNFHAIEAVWKGVQKAIDRGQNLNLTAVWDEFGSYDAFEDLECLGKSLRSLLRESSKHGYYPILIVHGDQASFYPGVSGILGTLKESTVKVESIGRTANAFGEMMPTGEVEVTNLEGNVTRFKVPEWLSVDLLISLLPGDTKHPLIDEILISKNTPAKGDTVKAESHTGVEVVSPTAEETVYQRVRRKIEDKIKSSNGEWISYRDLVSRSFSQDDDREMAKKILDVAVSRKLIECEKVTNPNNTETVRYRIASKSSANNN